MEQSLFPSEAGRTIKYLRFQRMALGELRTSLPIKELASKLPIQNPGRLGAPEWFDNEAKIALQFLKAREGCSDEKLLERLNTDWRLQLFCGICLGDNKEIKDKDVIWKARKFVAQHLNIEAFQKILIANWSSHMEDTTTGLCDATCYESYIKFPTDVKLLWDCIDWLHQRLKYWCRQLKIKMPRNKYRDHKKKQVAYNKIKKKTYNKRKSRVRVLLLLCDKLLNQLDLIFQHIAEQDPTADPFQTDFHFLDHKTWSRFHTIGKIYIQQRYLHDHPGEKVKNRIVSLYKPYLRPIVRGKENKRVEFGAKLNTWQVDGLNFIEHLSFEAFHEGIRLKHAVAFHYKHLKRLCRLGADAIYATNANRRFCKKLNIATNFKPKGRPKADPTIRQQESLARQALAKARATLLEGSYGNDKNHYGLQKVKARNEMTEVAWIFFGMMTANAVKVMKRIKAKNTPPTPRARPAPKLQAVA